MAKSGFAKERLRAFIDRAVGLRQGDLFRAVQETVTRDVEPADA